MGVTGCIVLTAGAVPFSLPGCCSTRSSRAAPDEFFSTPRTRGTAKQKISESHPLKNPCQPRYRAVCVKTRIFMDVGWNVFIVCMYIFTPLQSCTWDLFTKSLPRCYSTRSGRGAQSRKPLKAMPSTSCRPLHQAACMYVVQEFMYGVRSKCKGRNVYRNPVIIFTPLQCTWDLLTKPLTILCASRQAFR